MKILVLILTILIFFKIEAQNLAAFKDDNGLYGYKNEKGKVSIKPKFNRAYKFAEGMAAVCNEINKWGCINEKGKIIIPLIYDNYFYSWDDLTFHNGLIPLGIKYKYGYLDKTGKVIIPFKYSSVSHFVEDVANVSEGYINGKYKDEVKYVIDKTGKKLFNTAKYSYVSDFKNGISRVTLASSFLSGYINKTGIEVIPVKYKDIWLKDDGYFYVKENNKIGWYNTKFELTNPFKFEDYYEFENGFKRVKENGKWGCLNKEYKTVIPNIYDYFYGFNEGLSPVELNHQFGYVDTTGKLVIPLKYNYAREFKSGLAIVDLDDERFSIDKTGKKIEGTEIKIPKVLPQSEYVTDIDGNKYDIVKIGNQKWMKSNLWVKHYNDGESIEMIPDNTEWKSTKQMASCYYKNEEMLSLGTGIIYNMYVIKDLANVCPVGWHIPNEMECRIMIDSLAGAKTYLTGSFKDDNGQQLKAAVAIKSTGLWDGNDEITGTNSSGFSLNATGMRDEEGNFRNQGAVGYFWVKNRDTENQVFMLAKNSPIVILSISAPRTGYPIRCIKD